MAKKKDAPVLNKRGDDVYNEFLNRSQDLVTATAKLKALRPEVDARLMKLYHEEGRRLKDRPENFIVQADQGKVGAELKKKSKKQALSDDDAKFLIDNKIKHSIEKTEIDYVINPELHELLVNNPGLFHTISWMKTETGVELIKRIDQKEVKVVADETLGQVYNWAAEQTNLTDDELTVIISKYSTLAVTPVYEAALRERLYNTRYEALNADGEVFEHYKGGIYRVTAIEDSVVKYEHLWPHPHAEYERDQTEFFETVEFLGRTVPRFTPIEK